MAHCSSALRGTPLILWIALACASPLAAKVRAQPSVRVRAATQLELEALPSERGLTLQGTLRDNLGQPLPGRAIELQLTTDAGAKQQRTRQTGDDGSFRAVFTLPPGRYRALARFAGDVAYTEGEQGRELDAGKADVRLRFVEPRTLRVDLDEKTHVIAVRASSSAGGPASTCACKTSAATSWSTRRAVTMAWCARRCRARRSALPASAN